MAILTWAGSMQTRCSLSAAHENTSWQFRATIFHRRDDDLVDWTFLAGAPFLRQANPVDLDVTGADGFISWRSPVLEVVGGVSWLDKNADYGTAQVDASFYALNYARLASHPGARLPASSAT